MNTSIDFTPYFRSSIGFDRLFDLLQNASRVAESGDNWPRYDIVRAGEDCYSIRMAVAGFSSDELSLSYEPNLLVVRGNKAGRSDAEYLHRGLATRSFERKFELADYVEVAGATLENGLLTIELKRELPEALKPRQIPIGSFGEPAAPQQIEGQKQAA
jgi:molecular chaperone IbpA